LGWSAADNTKLVDARERFPLHAFYLFKTKSATTLKDVSDYRQRFSNAVDLFQAFDVLGAKVGSRSRQLHRSRSSKNNLGAYVCRAPLEVVSHAARKPGEKHYQANSERDAGHADERADRSLADVGNDKIVHAGDNDKAFLRKHQSEEP
jgi:hypothetical protein